MLVPPLQLDAASAQVWQGEQLLKLTPKAFAVLRYFSEHPGQLVTKDEVMRAVWVDTVVTDGALVACIRELRKALQDDARRPQYIETVHRRGYRFIAPVAVVTAPVSSSKFQVPSSDTRHSGLSTQDSLLVGREITLTRLRGWLAKALNGERQLVFVTGEPGIGKTTLVKAFLQTLDPRRSAVDWTRTVH